jgi:lipoprotein-anchoring transpeptidase ErfK/SrfK
MVIWLDSARKQLQSQLIMAEALLRNFCAVFMAVLVALVSSANGQTRPAPRPQALRKASDLIRKQEPVKINQSLLKQVTPDSVRLVVSLPKQRAYLMTGDQIVIDSPISSGKRGHTSPTGHLSVLEKDPNHHSSLYGDFVDSSGRVVRAGVSARIDAAPSGTHFTGAAMKWFMRLTEDGVGMHVGILPGYPASHGCIRMPPEGAKLFYDHVKVGTPVDVGDY